MKDSKEVRHYRTYLNKRELADSTIDLYGTIAAGFLDYAKGRGITKELVMEYKNHMSAKGYAVTTINRNLVAVNGYLVFAGFPQCAVKMKRIQRRKSLDKIPGLKEYQELLDYARETGREKYYLIIKLLACTGIRISELAYVTAESLGSRVIRVDNKGKEREIYLPDELRELLKAYCQEHGIEKGAVFTGNRGKAISRVGVYKMLVHMADMLGLPKGMIHPHGFRHMFALMYMEQYGNMPELADLLGHSSLETTRIYLTSSVEEKIRKLNGLNL